MRRCSVLDAFLGWLAIPIDLLLCTILKVFSRNFALPLEPRRRQTLRPQTKAKPTSIRNNNLLLQCTVFFVRLIGRIEVEYK